MPRERKSTDSNRISYCRGCLEALQITNCDLYLGWWFAAAAAIAAAVRKFKSHFVFWMVSESIENYEMRLVSALMVRRRRRLQIQVAFRILEGLWKH